MFDESQIKSKAFLVKEIVDLVMSLDNMKVEKVLLVGSYARGEENEWSDIDFLVQLSKKDGRLYPTWKQIQLIHKKLGSDRVHVIFGTIEAQASLFKRKGEKFKYREIPLLKESLC